MKVYQVNNNAEYGTAAEAIAAAEAAGGHATVIKFYIERNMPYCLPEFIHRSIGMWVYEDEVWTQRSIYSGVSDIVSVSRPD